METGLPAPLAWGRGGIGKVGFGGPHHPAGSSRSLPHHPSAPPTRPVRFGAQLTFAPSVYLTPLQQSPKPQQSAPHPLRPPAESRGRLLHLARGAENLVALCLGLPETQGRLPGSGPQPAIQDWEASAAGPPTLWRSANRGGAVFRGAEPGSRW